ncbi:site-specific integrase [Oenococcus sp.]|uniref:site-specific integrase n=1 Tax=Oenococcus sp. TaxID=1979414 RepID=UPI0039E75B30
MASIKKRGKYWQARISFQDPITGTYRTKNHSGFLTKSQAETWVGLFRSGKTEGAAQLDIPLADYFEQWFKTYKADKASQTLLQYRVTLKIIRRMLPKATLQTFDRDQFQGFINEYGKDHARETVDKRKMELAASLRDAFADGKIKTDPTQRLNMVSDPARTKDPSLKFLELTDARTLIDYCAENLTKTHFLIITGILSGARFGELRALQKADINSQKHTVSINKAVDGITGQDKATKNKQSNRVITMPEKWFGLYAHYQFKGSRLFEISSNGINKELSKVCHELNIKVVTFHALRHTHASILLAHDVSMQYVSERLGHANLSITEKIYSHLLADKRKSDEMKVNQIF